MRLGTGPIRRHALLVARACGALYGRVCRGRWGGKVCSTHEPWLCAEDAGVVAAQLHCSTHHHRPLTNLHSRLELVLPSGIRIAHIYPPSIPMPNHIILDAQDGGHARVKYRVLCICECVPVLLPLRGEAVKARGEEGAKGIDGWARHVEGVVSPREGVL